MICTEGAGGTVEDIFLWLRRVETANGVQLESVMGTLLVGSKGVDVPLNM